MVLHRKRRLGQRLAPGSSWLQSPLKGRAVVRQRPESAARPGLVMTNTPTNPGVRRVPDDQRVVAGSRQLEPPATAQFQADYVILHFGRQKRCSWIPPAAEEADEDEFFRA